MKTRFRVGEKVRVRKDARIEEGRNGGHFVSGYALLGAGNVYQVSFVGTCDNGTPYYRLKGEDALFYNRCLEPALDWDAFKTGEVQVHTPTLKAFKRFMKACKREGYHWRGGGKPTECESFWFFNRGLTCVQCAQEPGELGYHPMGFRASLLEVPTVVWR